MDSMYRTVVTELQLERLEAFYRSENCADLIRDLFLREFADFVPAVTTPDGGVYRMKCDMNGSTVGGGGGATSDAVVGDGVEADDDSDIHSGKLHDDDWCDGDKKNTHAYIGGLPTCDPNVCG